MICDRHHLTTWQPVWRLRAAAVSSAWQAKHHKHLQSLGQPRVGETKSMFKVFHVTDFFPRLDKAGFTLQSVAPSRAGLGVKRMRELCALYRTSGSNYSWLTSVKLRKASWLKMWMKNKITIFCQQVRWKHFFLYLAFLDFFFFRYLKSLLFYFSAPRSSPSL